MKPITTGREKSEIARDVLHTELKDKGVLGDYAGVTGI